MRPSKKHPDIEKIWLYECLFFNKTTGKCEEYAKRPMICRNTSCIDPTSEESISVQHKKFTSI